jgi:ABC-type transporter Mla subunit MlaD
MKTLFVTLLGLLLVLGTGGCSKQQAGYQVHARFANAQNLEVGDAVLMGGAQIGRVESLKPDRFGPGTGVTMEIKRTAVVKVDSIASIISGDSPTKNSISLSSGSPGAANAVHGATLRSAETTTP